MLIKVKNNTSELYSLNKLYTDNPSISFPKKPTEELLNSFDVYTVSITEKPAIDEKTQRVEPGDIVFVDGKWVKGWVVVTLSDEEYNDRKNEYITRKKEQRRHAYAMFADPIYFKWKRGEASEQDWVAAVDAVKSWYSDDY